MQNAQIYSRNPTKFAHQPDPYAEVQTGTTILAIVYDKGVIVGSDSRTSMGGSTVVDRSARKINYMSERIALLGAGSASDNQILARYVKNYMDQYAQELEEIPLVRSCAHLFHRIGYFNKNNLMSSLIVCGWDATNGPQIYAIPSGGAIIPRSNFYVAGSGGGLISGFLDSEWKPNMSFQEAQNLLLRAIGLSVKHDGYSGGGIRHTNICKEEMKESFCGYNEIPYGK